MIFIDFRIDTTLKIAVNNTIKQCCKYVNVRHQENVIGEIEQFHNQLKLPE